MPEGTSPAGACSGCGQDNVVQAVCLMVVSQTDSTDQRAAGSHLEVLGKRVTWPSVYSEDALQLLLYEEYLRKGSLVGGPGASLLGEPGLEPSKQWQGVGVRGRRGRQGLEPGMGATNGVPRDTGGRGGALLHKPTEDMKPGAAGWPSGEAMPVFLSQPDRRASYLPLLRLRKGRLRGQKDPSLLGPGELRA